MIEYKDIIKKAPLPFAGQKRNAIKPLYEYFKNIKIDKDIIIIDLFGGSGLLANLFKQLYPNNKVIYNDFDNYTIRLKNIDITNKHIDNMREIIKEYPKNKRIDPVKSEKIREYARNITDYYDKITLCTQFSFRLTKTEDIKTKACLYSNIKKSPYEAPENYLKDVKIINKDYKQVIKEYGFDKVIYLLDPPYIHTHETLYNKCFYNIRGFLELLNQISQMEAFILFMDTKGGMDDILEYFNYYKKWNSDRIDFANAINGTKKESLHIKI